VLAPIILRFIVSRFFRFRQGIFVLVASFKFVESGFWWEKGQGTSDSSFAAPRLTPKTKDGRNGGWTTATHCSLPVGMYLQ
jgi:hypothetical protein